MHEVIPTLAATASQKPQDVLGSAPPIEIDLVPEFNALISKEAIVDRNQWNNTSRRIGRMVRTLAPNSLDAIGAPSPVVEMGQLVVSNLLGCRLIWRCLSFLWKNFLVSGSPCCRSWAFSIIDFHLSIAPRQTRYHMTALHCGVRRKDRAYGLGRFN